MNNNNITKMSMMMVARCAQRFEKTSFWDRQESDCAVRKKNVVADISLVSVEVGVGAS